MPSGVNPDGFLKLKKMYKHLTRDGKEIALKDLEDSHLVAIIRRIKKLAKEGITLGYGGGGGDTDCMWYEEDTLTGKEVKKLMHYKEYKRELEYRRAHAQQRILDEFKEQ